MNRSIIISSLLLPLFACGGGSSGTTSDLDTPANSSTQTGVFLDSPIIQIAYQTETLSGFTNDKGEFDYLPGEAVTFSIGDLIFPSTPAIGVVTPLNIAGTTDIDDPAVINMIRLLQTLDSDGDPSNGITIADAAKVNAEQVDFSLTEEAFASLPAVSSLIANGGQTVTVTELVNTSDAIAHFEAELADAFSINMVGKIATSVMTSDEAGCNGVESILISTFTDTTMTRYGADGSDTETGTCVPNEDESQSVVMTSLATDYDIPFNCADYPICTTEDFNKVISTSTYSFTPSTNQITYTSTTGGGHQVIEVITIQDFSLNMVNITASSVVTSPDAVCEGVVGGFDYTFTDTDIVRTGSDNINSNGSSCSVSADETQTIAVASLAGDFDIPFNCADYPICTHEDFNQDIIYTEGGTDYSSKYIYDPSTKKITYQTKAGDEITATEVITLIFP
jgi:hypothetical protein